MPATLTVVRQAYDDPVRRTRALGVWSMIGAVGAAAGTVTVLSTVAETRGGAAGYALAFTVCAGLVVLASCAAASWTPGRTANGPRGGGD